MKPRVKAGTSVPQSIAAAEAAESIKNSIAANSIGQGEKPTTAPTTPNGAPTRKERRRKAAEKPVPSDTPPQGRAGRKGQTELPGMPEADGAGKAARKYLDVLDTINTLTEEKGPTMQALINALKKSKRTSIQVDGWHFQLKHRGPEDKIVVKKPK